ncbi:MAG: PA4642 family protein [Pseudohongiella sp.]|uniref:PA4642 family protein n=1 Tax=Pseudohongiella sp. TaxID=1979412 RepID=UPI00349FE8C0
MIEEKKTGKERTQPATRNEEWSDERIRSFLDLEPPESVPAAYHILTKAYRGMLPEHFARFVPFFVAAGHDVNVTLPNGTTFLDHVSQHRAATPYIEVLEAAGAKRGNPA